MPILLKCHGCSEQLEVDEGFAGGVCRCVHCKALNHVPTQTTELDNKGRPKTPPPMAKPVVMAPEQLQSIRIAETSAFVASQKRRGLLAIIMLIVAIALAVVLFFLIREMRQQPTEEEVRQQEEEKITEQATAGLDRQFKDFAGLTFQPGPVAFLLNTANSVGDNLPYAKLAVEYAIARRQDDARRYVVITWGSKTEWGFDDEPTVVEPKAFPDQGLAAADNADQRDALATWMTDRVGSGSGDPTPAVVEALARGATVLVLVTREDIKAEQVKAVREAIAGKDLQLLALSVSRYEKDRLAQLSALVGAENIAVAGPEQIEDWSD